jgi:uncharacterized membrane protein
MKYFIFLYIVIAVTACSFIPKDEGNCNFNVSTTPILADNSNRNIHSKKEQSYLYKHIKEGELAFSYKGNIADTIRIYNDKQIHTYHTAEEQVISLEEGKYTIKFKKNGYYDCYIKFDLYENNLVYIENIEFKTSPKQEIAIPIGHNGM